MGWSVEQVWQMRESMDMTAAPKSKNNKKKEDEEKTTGKTALTTPKPTGNGWTPEQVREMRKELTDATPVKSGSASTGTQGLDSKKLADEVLDSVLGTATGSPVKPDRQEDYEPDWN